MSIQSQLASIVGAYFSAAPDPNSLYNGQASLVASITSAVGVNTAVLPEVQRFMLTNARFGMSMPQEQLVATLAMVYTAPPTSTADLANTASKLQTPRAVSMTGAATATAVQFDGSADVALNVTSLDAAKLTGNVAAARLPAATSSAAGTIKQMPAMTDVLVAPTALNWNALLAALRTSGALAT